MTHIAENYPQFKTAQIFCLLDFISVFSRAATLIWKKVALETCLVKEIGV